VIAGLESARATTEEIALRTRDLAIGYRARGRVRAVLERVNLHAKRGDLVCLLGPNGAGKSTLLRTLARMQPALWGSIELNGRDLGVMATGEIAQHLAVVLTERVVVDAMRARRIVELGRYPHAGWLGRLNARDHDVVSWAIEAVGAQHLAARDISQLSDGERQRVMVARALAQEPAVLVLDEPTAFLDVPSRVELMALLRSLTRTASIAAVLSTHDLEIALRTADVIWLVMPGGEIVSGSPEDVMISGAIADAFEGRQVRFAIEERGFRWLTGDRGTAQVTGHGIHATLARAVVEREGYAIDNVSDVVSEPPDVRVHVNHDEWCVHAGGRSGRGRSFASLAAFLRDERKEGGR